MTILGQTPEASTSVTIRNNTTSRQHVTFSPIDIRSYSEDGAIAFVEKPTDAGEFTLASFVRIATKSAELMPGEAREIPVRILNSDSLSPGGHYAALIASFTQDNAHSFGRVVPAVTSVLLVRKTGGERYGVSLRSFEFPPVVTTTLPKTIAFRLENTGNTHGTPRGVIEIFDLTGRIVAKGIVNEESAILLPESRRQIRVEIKPVDQIFPIMLYRLTLSGRLEPSDVTYTTKASFILVKPAALLGGIVIFSLILWTLIRLLRRMKK